jgi:hypothetical protein
MFWKWDLRLIPRYHNRSRNVAGEEETGAIKVPLDTLLETSDYVVLVCPSTAETRHLIDGAALTKMKTTATLVNVARGPVVDTDALTVRAYICCFMLSPWVGWAMLGGHMVEKLAPTFLSPSREQPLRVL